MIKPMLLRMYFNIFTRIEASYARIVSAMVDSSWWLAYIKSISKCCQRFFEAGILHQ